MKRVWTDQSVCGDLGQNKPAGGNAGGNHCSVYVVRGSGIRYCTEIDSTGTGNHGKTDISENRVDDNESRGFPPHMFG